MTNDTLRTYLVSCYRDLLRIQNAEDQDAEIKRQLTETGAQLEKLGVAVEQLRME